MVENEEMLPAPRGIRREQKIGFVLLLIFALLSIALGVVQIRNTMYAPFALSNKVPAIYKDTVNGVETLRFRDTDNDGLNDFDELYVHQTSPYLADTDSDGTSDQEEITKGENPLCTKGKSCDESIVFAVPSNALIAPNPVEAPPNMQDLLKDPKKVRLLLVESGMKQTEVDKISDKDLLAVITQVLSNTKTEQTGSGNP